MAILKKYLGTAYIGVVGPDLEYGSANDSIRKIVVRSGDNYPIPIRATKGFEGREWHINNFIKSNHDWILLLDADMEFQPDTLERLRSHQLPYVSGYYLRRRFQPIAPVWFRYNPNGEWPHMPWMVDPERGKLHKLGASGWGCVLVHREVFEAVGKLLKGEPFVLEDDMDIWPYNLDNIMAAMKIMEKVIKKKSRNADDEVRLKASLDLLKQEIRPLTGQRTVIGSDIRFPYYAHAAGHVFWGDPDVRCGHIVHYPLHPNDFSELGEQQKDVFDGVKRGVLFERKEWRQRIKELTND